MGSDLGDAVFRVPGKLRLAVSDDVLGGQDSPGALRLAADLRDPEYTGPESAPVLPEGRKVDREDLHALAVSAANACVEGTAWGTSTGRLRAAVDAVLAELGIEVEA